MLFFFPGLYACRGGQNSPCLVYVGFNQKIYVYWSVMLERIESSNILRVLEGNNEFASILKELHVGKCLLLNLLDTEVKNNINGRVVLDVPLSTSRCVPITG